MPRKKDVSDILNKIDPLEIDSDNQKGTEHIAPITADAAKDIFAAKYCEDPLKLVLEALDISDTLKAVYEAKLDTFVPREYNKFTDLLLDERMVALLMNLGCLQADKGKAYKYLEYVSTLIMNNGLSNEIRVVWNNSDEETSIDNWNKKVDEYTTEQSKDTNNFKSIVVESPLLTEEEKITLLGMNQVSLNDLVKKLKKIESEEV